MTKRFASCASIKQANDDLRGSDYLVMIHIKDQRKFKELIHPNITDNIDYYKKGNYYLFPTYHGCGLRNRVDYKRGYQCVFEDLTGLKV